MSNAQNCLQLQDVFASKHILYIEAVYLYQSLSCLHCIGKAKGKGRGDYDYCRVPGTRQLSPLEVGEDNSKFEPKKLRKIQIH